MGHKKNLSKVWKAGVKSSPAYSLKVSVAGSASLVESLLIQLIPFTSSMFLTVDRTGS